VNNLYSFAVIFGIPAVFITICNFRFSCLHLAANFLHHDLQM